MRLHHLVAFANVALSNITIGINEHHPFATTTVTKTITTTASEASFTMVIERLDATTMITLSGPSINVIVPQKGKIIFGTENLESMLGAIEAKDSDRDEYGEESKDHGRGEPQEEDEKAMDEKVMDEKVMSEKVMDEMSEQTQSESEAPKEDDKKQRAWYQSHWFAIAAALPLLSAVVHILEYMEQITG